MKNLSLIIFALVGLMLSGLTYTAEDFSALRTEWNQPDLQGVWNFSSDIPLQRSTQYGEREFLTAEEIDEIKARRAAIDEFSDAAIPNSVKYPSSSF